jgi:hypothetical protein
MLDSKGDIEMTSDELRSILGMITNYSFEYLQSLSHEELLKMYEERH